MTNSQYNDLENAASSLSLAVSQMAKRIEEISPQLNTLQASFKAIQPISIPTPLVNAAAENMHKTFQNVVANLNSPEIKNALSLLGAHAAFVSSDKFSKAASAAINNTLNKSYRSSVCLFDALSRQVNSPEIQSSIKSLSATISDVLDAQACDNSPIVQNKYVNNSFNDIPLFSDDQNTDAEKYYVEKIQELESKIKVLESKSDTTGKLNWIFPVISIIIAIYQCFSGNIQQEQILEYMEEQTEYLYDISEELSSISSNPSLKEIEFDVE